ncbi:MAG: redoxin domain-containing protein [Victivallales bacterium]|nr:redoxin domain-containing protein [Victivallales bacterium]
MKKRFFCVSLLLLTGSLTGLALNPGDPAPELQVACWIKNGPVKINDGKNEKVKIIEFWKTECKPCRQIIPGLQQLQTEFRDSLVIVSISPEPAATIKEFIAREAADINYAVAADDKNKTFKAYMQGRENIPAAFIINKNGAVAWIGHPMNMYLPLKRIITGKFNIRKNAEEQEVLRQIQVPLSQKDYPAALKIVNSGLEKSPDNIRLIALKIFILFNNEQKKQAVEFADDMLKKHPCNLELFELKSHMLNQLQRYQEMDAFALEFVGNCKDEPLSLNQLSRKLLGTRFGEARLEPALKAAELAYSNRKLRELQRADIGETLARIYYMIGCIDRAVKIQTVVCRILKKNRKSRYVFAMKILHYYRQAYTLGQGSVKAQTGKQQ